MSQPAPQSTRAPLSILKRLLFAAITLLVVLGLLELALWLGGVPTLLSERDPYQGFSGSLQVYEPDRSGAHYQTRRRAVLHSFNYQRFLRPKPEGGYRLFVLGGSSAYGFPWGAGVAFPHLLGRALDATWPERPIESINAAAMSYGSHRLRILADELLQYEPDLFVLYTGHNEFVEQRFYENLARGGGELDRVRVGLYRLRSFSALTRLYERLARPEREEPVDPEAVRPGELLGLDVTRRESTDVTEADREAARQRFEENVAAILDRAAQAGVDVVLCTVPSNLRGWRPNQSVFAKDVGSDQRQQVAQRIEAGRAALDAGDAQVAVTALETARSIDAGYAETHFLLGRAYEALERWPEAAESYRRARDTDGRPARAVAALNATLRRLARERDLVLVDAERSFAETSPHGLVGFDLVEDYVHPNPAGHRLVALELWRALLERGLLGKRHPVDLALFERATEGAGATATANETSPALLYNLAVVLENQGRYDQAMERYRDCLRLNPDYRSARYNLGRLLTRTGRFDEAVAAHQETLSRDPSHLKSMLGLGEALRQLGRLDEARAAFERATRTDPRSAEAWDRLGVTLSQAGRLGEAEAALLRSLELDPDVAETQADLGFTLLFQARLDEALARFERALELQPDHARGRNGRAAVLAERGQLDEAERLFRRSLEVDPRDAFAQGGLELIRQRRPR